MGCIFFHSFYYGDFHLTSEYNTIQCNAMQCNAMQCNAMQCNAMQCNAMQCSAVQCSAMQCNTIQYNIVYFQHRTQHNSKFYPTLGWLERGGQKNNLIVVHPQHCRVKLLDDPEKIATKRFMAFLSSLRSIVKHTKSRHHSDHQKVFKLDFKKRWPPIKKR